jgi:uncharacterized membrane protein
MRNTSQHPELEVIDIEMFRPMHWLGLAWKDIERCPTAGVVHGLILALVSGGLFWFARHDFWLIVAMLSISMIIAPLLATGLYDISRRLERGEQATLADAFRIWTCGDKRMIQFGLLLALSSAGWFICSAALIHWMLPDSVYTPADFLRLVVLQPNFGLFEIWVLMGALTIFSLGRSTMLLGAPATAMSLALLPVASFLLAFFILGEVPNVFEILGAIAISLGAFLAALSASEGKNP